MKKMILMAVAAMMVSTSVNAQVTVTIDNQQPFSAEADTTFTLEGHRVKVEEGKNLQNKIEKKNKNTLVGLHFGWAFALGSPDGMSVNKKVLPTEIGFEMYLHNFKFSQNALFHVNLGFNWKNFRMRNGNSFEKDYTDGGKIKLGQPQNLGTTGYVRLSRIKIFSLQLPLLFEYRGQKNFFVAAGPVVNFNMHGSILTKYTNDRGEKVQFESNGLRQSPVTVDLKGMIGLHKGLALYTRWSPMRQLRKSYAPDLDFSAISVGLQLVP